VTLKLTLSEAAVLSVGVSRSVAGHRRHGRCTTHVHKGKRCTINLRVKTLQRSGRAGQNSLRLGRLRAGRYTVSLTATDATHLRSRKSLRFRIK